MPVDAPCIGHYRRTLLRATAFSHDETGVHVIQIKSAEFFHRDCFVVELAFFGRVLAARDPAELGFGLLPSVLGRPDSMQADGEASSATGRSILNEIAAFARGEDAQAEAGQFVVPDEVILLANLGGFDNSFGQLCHQT